MTQPHFGAPCLPCANPDHGHTTLQAFGSCFLPALGAESLGLDSALHLFEALPWAPISMPLPC